MIFKADEKFNISVKNAREKSGNSDNVHFTGLNKKTTPILRFRFNDRCYIFIRILFLPSFFFFHSYFYKIRLFCPCIFVPEAIQ